METTFSRDRHTLVRGHPHFLTRGNPVSTILRALSAFTHFSLTSKPGYIMRFSASTIGPSHKNSNTLSAQILSIDWRLHSSKDTITFQFEPLVLLPRASISPQLMLIWCYFLTHFYAREFERSERGKAKFTRFRLFSRVQILLFLTRSSALPPPVCRFSSG